MWLVVLGIILLAQLGISLIMLYLSWGYGIDHMPIYYEWEYIKNESCPTIKGAAFGLMIFCLPINLYFLIFKWICIFCKYIINKSKGNK